MPTGIDFVSLAVVGAVVSLIVQFVKTYAGTSQNGTIAVVVVLSAIAGAVWYFVKDNQHLVESAMQILVFANAVYGFILRKFETPKA